MTGSDLRALRESAGLTQDALAELLGFTGSNRRTRISDWETGHRPINNTTAIAIQAVIEKHSKK